MNTVTQTKIISPFQAMRPSPGIVDIRNNNHPAKDEIKRLCSTKYNIEVSFSEDVDTLKSFQHIPGLVAILCTLTKDGQIVAFGRSCAVLGRFNKYLERTISTAINGSFLSATNSASKVFEALRVNEAGREGLTEDEEIDLATPKQKSYLSTLIQERVPFNERDEWLKELTSISRSDASDKIADLLNNY